MGTINLQLRKEFVGFFIAFVCFLTWSAQCIAGELCSGKNATIECLMNNFDKLYTADYAKFWDILHGAAGKAMNCGSRKDTVRFLKLIRLKSINAEFNEFYSETIEDICVKETNCFLTALLELKKEDQVAIVTKLKTPLAEEESVVKASLVKYRNNTNYKEIVEFYLKETPQKR